MILHLVNQSPLNGQSLALCLRCAAPADTILLLEDGVAAGAREGEWAAALRAANVQRIVAQRDDVLSRGLGERLAPDIDLIGYDEFVALCCTCDKVQSWF